MPKRLIGLILFVIIGLVIAIARPFAPELSPIGHLVLMALITTVGLWIFATKWVPLSVGAAFIMMVLTAIGLKPSSVFSGFTNSAIWILIPALFFGFALNKTGLGRRLAYWIMRLFRPSYLTLTISWVIIGLVLSALTPSINVRVAIVIPIAVSVVNICGLQPGSKGAGFILLTAWAMVLIPGTGWLTGSLWGPIGGGFFEAIPDLRGVMTFDSWSKTMLLPAEVLALVFILGLYAIMKPSEPLNIDPNTFKTEYKNLGPTTFREKATLIILVLAFLMFVTGQWHQISNVAIALGAFFLLAVFNVIELKDIGPGISWNLVIFAATTLSMAAVFYDSGVSSFLSAVLAPLAGSLAASPWLYLFGVLVVLIVWRFIDVSQLNPTMPIIIPVFAIIAREFGISPLVSFSLIVMAGDSFFMSYQQPFVLMAEVVAGKTRWTPAQLAKGGLVYFVACLITLAISVPYWQVVGLIK